MNALPVPKFMQWQPSLNQTFECNKKVLLVSGCSFTASTLQLETAASWPGYVMDRCRFSTTVDYSYPGVGNLYIHDSIRNYLDTCNVDTKDILVLIMWTGIDRLEHPVAGDQQPNLNGRWYKLLHDEIINNQLQVSKEEKTRRATHSAELMLDLHDHLVSKNISFGYIFYSNLLFPPYIPKRDLTFEFDNYVDASTLEKLKNLPWLVRDPMSHLYEYAFANDFLNDGDGFHPPAQCNLQWTDNVLLPAMLKQDLIRKYEL